VPSSAAVCSVSSGEKSMSGLQQSAVPAAGPTRHARRSPQSDGGVASPQSDGGVAPRTRSDLWFAISAALLAFWALFQNLYKIGTAPIVADEPTYIIAARRYIQGQVAAPRPVKASNYLGATPDNFEHPPLVKYLFGIAQRLDGSPTSLNAPRVVSGLATVLAAAVVAVWIGRVVGRWTGLLAGAMLTVIPEASSGSLGRFDRFAMLDPTASALMVLSVVVAWVWAHRSGRAGWVYAALTGVAVGLASGAKENGFLGAVGPVLLTARRSCCARRRPCSPSSWRCAPSSACTRRSRTRSPVSGI
jgi:4-amino-4-deoxy-L-arabinose transferase-like glycosyltransferase